MNQLFIELYLDEDVNVLVADLIKARGFQAITVREAGQLGKSDAEQLAYAVNHQKVLLTHNRVDFERLAQSYFDRSQNHFGIIIAVRNPPQEITRRLLIILDRVTADEMQNQVRYV
jgi:predicted nuclease of predicted toxin-antitoxin system